MLSVISAISKSLALLASIASTSFLAFVAFVLFLQVIFRYIFNSALSWPEEASRIIMIWSVMLMGSVLVHDQALVNVDFFDYLWPTKIRIYRNIVWRVLLLAVIGVIFKEGISQAQHGWMMRTTALEISWFWPYLAIPVGAGLMFFQMISLIIRDASRAFRNRKENE